MAPEWFATHDPIGRKLGSGGGTAHLIHQAWQSLAPEADFESWASEEKRLIIHAGGQSRRLPAYASGGKALVPVPIFRWMRGQRIDQTLLDLQLPLFERLVEQSPPKLRWLIASGDALVWNEAPLGPLPDVDVLCLGLWDNPERASHHGCFFSSRQNPTSLSFMLQKPSVAEIQSRMGDNFFLLDVGIWMLSDRAMRVLMDKSGYDAKGNPIDPDNPPAYDLYSDFGPALGLTPTVIDPAVNALTCGLLDLPSGEFYHFGTNAEIVQSSLALQNRVIDQRRIRSSLPKPHPSIFVQNATTQCALNSENRDIWIENSHVGNGWSLQQRHVITGVPPNEWSCALPPGACLDFVPMVGDGDLYAVRFYGWEDPFRGAFGNPATVWHGVAAARWAEARHLDPQRLGWGADVDIQNVPLFPVLSRDVIDGAFLQWLFDANIPNAEAGERFSAAVRKSAEELGASADLTRLFNQRRKLMQASLPILAAHSNRSVFHQIDLAHAAEAFHATGAPLPEESPAVKGALQSFLHDRMFRASVERLRGGDPAPLEKQAFEALRQEVIDRYRNVGKSPVSTFLRDQVIWGRAPARLDLAGGWSDTPPYCFLAGGNVVNLAADLNGQPPIQVFARRCAEPHLVVQSIDLGQSVCFKTYEELAHYQGLNSSFAIPRAAFALAGFHPQFLQRPRHQTLADQLREFGGGIEISLLCAIPKGSGLGTSSILAGTILGVLSEAGALDWSLDDIGARVLAVEQMLTSGGGWQDQFGGLLRSVKLLQSGPGLEQKPVARWLPDNLFRSPAHQPQCLLYYTGLTRVAHNILGEIVRGMFLNRRDVLRHLDEISQHAFATADAIQSDDFDGLARCVRRSWILNQALDDGTNPPEVQRILKPLEDWVGGMKLLGAGGGGYLLMLAKDADAAGRIRRYLGANPPNDGARFVAMTPSDEGLRITRS